MKAMKAKKAKQVKKSAVQKYKEIDSLIGSVSNLTDYEKKDLAKRNFFALMSNIEMV
jgi:hypothetical protein